MYLNINTIDFGKILITAEEKLIFYIPKVLLAILILWLGFKLVAKILVFLDKIFSNFFDDTLRPFFVSAIRFISNATVIMAAAGTMGFDVAGLVGIFAAAAFAIGMALQGSLGNFASGILILTLKPYRVQDWIQVEDKFGKVEEIGIFNTIIETPGNKILIVPNSKITDGVVTNYSKKGIVRLEIDVTMPYSEDFPRVKHIIQNALKSVDHIMSEPLAEIGIENFDSHSVNIIVRPYTKPKYFWQVTFDVHQAIKAAFSEHGIQVAYSEGVEMGNIGK